MIWKPSDADDYRIVVIPEELHALIEQKLDAAIAEHPEAEKDREVLRNHLLRYVDEHGEVPDFTLSRKSDSRPSDDGPAPPLCPDSPDGNHHVAPIGSDEEWMPSKAPCYYCGDKQARPSDSQEPQ